MLFVMFWHIVLLEDASMALDFKNAFVFCDFWSMDSCHARFLFEHVNGFFICIGTGPNSLRSPINYVFVDRTLIKS